MTKLRYYNQLGVRNCKNIIDAVQGEEKLFDDIRLEDDLIINKLKIKIEGIIKDFESKGFNTDCTNKTD